MYISSARSVWKYPIYFRFVRVKAFYTISFCLTFDNLTREKYKYSFIWMKFNLIVNLLIKTF